MDQRPKQDLMIKLLEENRESLHKFGEGKVILQHEKHKRKKQMNQTLSKLKMFEEDGSVEISSTYPLPEIAI